MSRRKRTQDDATMGDVLQTGGEPLSAEAKASKLAVAMLGRQDTIFFVGLGHLKDGRHVAFEAEVEGRKVLKWTPICAKATVDAPERAWWQIHYARLYLRRELTDTELAANERDTKGVRPEDFAHGKAVAIHGNGKATAALAVSLEGMTVAEPEVLTKAPRDFCMLAIGRWAGLNMLPRRKA